VDSCPADARIFGNLSDENSAPSQLLALYPSEVLKANKGTKPKVFYIRKFANA
jgi:molybdopterin-containing oxidoreductase family iron-sulfur binding subunit